MTNKKRLFQAKNLLLSLLTLNGYFSIEGKNNQPIKKKEKKEPAQKVQNLPKKKIEEIQPQVSKEKTNINIKMFIDNKEKDIKKELIPIITSIYIKGQIEFLKTQKSIMIESLEKHKNSDSLNEEQKSQMEAFLTNLKEEGEEEKESINKIKNSPSHQVEGEKLIENIYKNETFAKFMFIFLFLNSFIKENPEVKGDLKKRGSHIKTSTNNLFKEQMESLIESITPNSQNENEEVQKEKMKQLAEKQKKSRENLFEIYLIEVYTSVKFLHDYLVEKRKKEEINSYILIENKSQNIVDVLEEILFEFQNLQKNTPKSKELIENFGLILPIIINLSRLN